MICGIVKAMLKETWLGRSMMQSFDVVRQVSSICRYAGTRALGPISERIGIKYKAILINRELSVVRFVIVSFNGLVSEGA